MNVTFDDDVNALYIPLQELKPGIAKRQVWLDHGDFKAGILMDLDENDNPVGIEIMLDDPTEEGIRLLKKHFKEP
jgi:uncharacterized protein YuzE